MQDKNKFSKISFDPDRINGDSADKDEAAPTPEFDTEHEVQQPDAPDTPDMIDLSKTVVFDTAEIADELTPEPAFDRETEASEDAEYVVLTPSKEGKKAAPESESADDGEFVELVASGKAEPEQATEKPPVIIRVLKYLLPWKGDMFVDILRKVVFALAVVGLIVSSCYIGDFFLRMADNNRIISEARGMYDADDNTVDQETGVYNRFNELIAQNSDCVGWITVPNTKIDNPVYQTTDNSYYLKNNSNKEPSVYGAVFADYRDLITRAGNTKNVTLYGHHMKDGTMFAQLHKYKTMSFYQENPVISFDTKYGTGGRYKVVGCFITNSDPIDDNGYYFDFATPSFRSDADFMNWIEQIRRRCLYITPVDVTASDEILTLSTCTYEVKGSNLLCVVVARKVRDGESVAVNTIDTYSNSKIIYPAVWYETLGGKKPTYTDGVYTWVSGDYNREDINAPTNTSSLETESMLGGESTEGAPSTQSTLSSELASSGEESVPPETSGESTPTESTSAEPPTESTACAHEVTELRDKSDATCGKDGYTGDTYCTVCNEKTATGETVPATGEHTYGDPIISEDGTSQTKRCTVCGHELTENIASAQE